MKRQTAEQIISAVISVIIVIIAYAFVVGSGPVFRGEMDGETIRDCVYAYCGNGIYALYFGESVYDDPDEFFQALPDHETIEYKNGYSGITVTYKGSLEDVVFQLVGGIRSGMGYCGCPTIEELHERGKFVKISAASLKESHPHDIHITKEAPNYSVDE